ncbi:nucleolar protein 8-like isoform X1 [Lytechinus pictus]|uniref:nucleolar protein 8-like isoform X1 n=2 Tax=Lytechinus pictus TaxID=7653 RepID=UPI0030B9B5D2
MADTQKRRLFIGGLHHDLKEKDLRERFARHGTISSLEIKTKKDSLGTPLKTFAHMDIVLTENEMKKCMSIYNNTKWNGNTMQIQLAKESFLTRLEQERAAACSEIKEDLIVRPKEKSPHQAAAEKRLKENFDKAGVSEFVVKGKVPGTQIEGEKNWIVGKYGRVLPVVYVRRKDKQKVVCCDPSKFSHHLKKFKKDDKLDEGIEMPKIEQLTWDIPEIHSEVSKKRKGIFSQETPLKLDRKKVKGDVALKKDMLPSSMLPEYKVKSSNLGQSDSDFDDIDDEDAVTSIPSIDGHIQNITGSKEQPTDFEIVRDGTSHISLSSRTNSSLFDSKPGYDSDDRESVDTDELCTLIRSSKNSSTVQTNGDLNKKETYKTLLPTEDQVARTIAMKRANQTIEEEKGGGSSRNEYEYMGILKVQESLEVGESYSENEEEDSSLNSDYASNDELHKDSEEDEKNSDKDVIDYGHVPSLNFEPLILDQSYIQGLKNTKVLSNHHKEDEEDSEEDSEGDKEEENGHESDAGEEESVSQDNLDDDIEEEEEEMLGSPIARFDFEPLILDREAIKKSMGVETKRDQTNIGCHTEDEKFGSDNSETNDDSEEESSSGSSIKSSDDEEDASEDVNNSDPDDSSDGVFSNQIKKSIDPEDKSNIFLEVETSATKQEVKKSPTGLEQKNDRLNQAMYDKSGRLLSKAAKKKLAREEAEKQKQANERRLESMKQQQRALLDRQGAIKGALSAVDDKEKKQGKHITFDSDDGESEGDTGLNDETNFAGQKIQSSTSLFESDDDSDDDEEEEDSLPENRGRKMWDDDEDDDGVDDERFKIKPQYEGEAGQKLIQMEARYGGDNRFKLDSRFLDRKDENAGSGSEGEGNENGEDDLSGDLQEEKRRSLAILQNMLGTPVLTSSKAVEPNFKDPSQLHYDPSRDEHSKYELQGDDHEDGSDANKLEEDMRKEKRKMDEERSKLPEVSKEKFFQVSSNLKDAFSAGEMEENADRGGGTFTFFGGDNSDIEGMNLVCCSDSVCFCCNVKQAIPYRAFQKQTCWRTHNRNLSIKPR